MGKGREAIDIVGQRFGRWTVVQRVERTKTHATFLCRCDCGAENVVKGVQLRRGTSKSCGCLRRELSSARETTHGLSKHRLFPTWLGMMKRCYNPENPAFKDYGGRGISVCPRWHDVTNFIADVEHKAVHGFQMDRIDNDGPYSPENTRWITAAANALNRRSNVKIEYNGRTQTLFEWARELGLPPRTLWARIQKSKWPVELALSTPVKNGQKVISRGPRKCNPATTP